MNIFESDTDDLVAKVISLNHEDWMEITSSNGTNGAYEFRRIHDYVLCFDENLALLSTLQVDGNFYKNLRKLIEDLKSWT